MIVVPMLTETNDRHNLRAAIDAQLRTDPDLNAFLVDFFPRVYQRCGSAMQRADKINLLFSLADIQQIADKLQLCATIEDGLTPRNHPWRLRLTVAVAVTVAAASIGLWMMLHPGRLASSAPANLQPRPPSDTAVAAPAGSTNSGNIIVNSPGSQMSNVVSGSQAGSASTAASANSGNRIEGSAGAVMYNEVKFP